jgi:hypothetical protein
MLQRSIWSKWFLSAAVASVGLWGGATLAQVAGDAAPATEPAPAAKPAPAAAPAAAPDAAHVKLADDVLFYSLVNNTKMAKESADVLLEKKLAPKSLLEAFQAAADGRDFRNIIVQDLRRPELKESLAKLLEVVDQGFRDVARNSLNIRQDIERLNGGPRPYQNAKDRLTAAGQYAVPLYLQYLQDNSRKDLHPYILRVLGEIGRPLLTPLIEQLQVADPVLRVQLINVIGQIAYPQALPALRALESDAAMSDQVKQACRNAIMLIDGSGRAAKLTPAELYLAGGENYYHKKASYLPPLPEEKTNPVWYYDATLKNVKAVQVPTEIWNRVMALRMAESTIKMDPNNAAAISLWLAANLQREIQLPAGATDDSKSPLAQDAAFYANAFGQAYLNPVLARALDDHDAALALRAIAALETTGTVSGLVSGTDAPLVRALANADRAVRFTAAFALARANPLTPFPSSFRVVPIMAEAVSNSASPSVLLIVTDDDMRNAVTEALRNSDAHYTVYAGRSITAALEQARRAPALDVVIIPEGKDVESIATLGRTDYRLSNVPVLVAAKTADLATIKNKYAPQKGYGVIDSHADEASITAALAAARADLGIVTGTPEQATAYSLTALKLLDLLAADHRSIYPLNEAVTTLCDALKDKRPDVAAGAATVLGHLNSPDGQRALATVAVLDNDTALRVGFFENLAENAKRTGNILDASQVKAIIVLINAPETDGKIRAAAAKALGALNLPSNQARDLILQQVR